LPVNSPLRGAAVRELVQGASEQTKPAEALRAHSLPGQANFPAPAALLEQRA
jgi:hypothetical protein